MSNYLKWLLLVIIAGCVLPLELAVYAAQEAPQEIFEHATVIEIDEVTDTVQLNEQHAFLSDRVFLVELEIKTGERAGDRVTVEHIIADTDAFPIHLTAGQDVVVYYSEGQFYIQDYYRKTGIYVLIALFALVILAVGRFQGLKTLLTLAITMALIGYVLVPLMIKGVNPVLVTVLVAAVITAITIVIITGWSIKSAAAIIGTLAGVLLAAVISYIASKAMYLTGLSNEEAMMLNYIPQGKLFNASQLLLSGIILGSLGAVMDVAMSISSSIVEIRQISPQLKVLKLFRSGMNIGRDIMGTMTNTLILAYTGSFLPLVLLMNAYQTPAMRIMNMDLIATEVVRALAGSIGIVLSIPVTALVAAGLNNRH